MILLPNDQHNRALLANAHPPDWINPTPATRYHLVVLGAGTAGLVAAAGAAGLGARVALVERTLLGGDCLNFGCVPSKAVLRSARAWAEVHKAAQLGVEVSPGFKINFAEVMERMRRLRSLMSPNDSAQRFRDLGVDVFLGAGQFIGPQALTVQGQTLHFQKAILAMGARAAIPPIPGLAEVGYLTNETVFSLTELPRRLAILGAGPIGCELAQAFARFGSEVTLFDMAPRILGREDPEASQWIAQSLKNDGVNLWLDFHVERLFAAEGTKCLVGNRKGTNHEWRGEQILVAMGRSPNVEGMGLELAQVKWNQKQGVVVTDRLQTTNPRIYAAGDVCSRFQFTHAADALARVAVQNALFWGRAKASALIIPWCIYTDPELARVGLGEREAAEQGIPIQTFRQDFDQVDRAILDGATEGFVKIHVQAGTDRIIGAVIACRYAGELIHEITLAMVGRLGLKTLAKTIHPYPTHGEAIKKIGDAYNRTRLTGWVKWLLKKWLR